MDTIATIVAGHTIDANTSVTSAAATTSAAVLLFRAFTEQNIADATMLINAMVKYSKINTFTFAFSFHQP